MIRIENGVAESCGYKDTVSYCRDRACSREKGLYYFKYINNQYKHIWFIEDDVFIPFIKTIESIDSTHVDYDLLVRSHDKFMKNTIDKWYHWHKVINTVCEPYGRSMICAIRVSADLLDCIDNYAKMHGKLYFCECLFNTIALHNNLSVKCPEELKYIDYLRNTWKGVDIDKYHLFHPVKDLAEQKRLRISYR